MIGQTNSERNFKLLGDLPNSNLIVWLDGTDFINHSPLGDKIQVTNMSNYNTLGVEYSYHCYQKAGASSNAIKLSPINAINLNDYTIMCWGNKRANSNHMNLFTMGMTSAPLCEIRFRASSNTQCHFNHKNGDANAGSGINIGDVSNSWHHYAVSYEGYKYCDFSHLTGFTMFFDGVCSYYFYNSGVSPCNPTIWQILGTTCYTADTGGASSATDYRVYSPHLTPSQIKKIYDMGPQVH